MQMSCNKNVISFGNSWIVCKSKSYNGRIYYYNILTRVAVWNLSDIKKEKSDNSTNIINCSDLQTGKYPEPENSPYDHSNICSSNHNSDQTEIAPLEHVNSINNSSITHIQMPLLTEGHCCRYKHRLTYVDIHKSPEVNLDFCNTSLIPTHSNNINVYNVTEDSRFVQTTSLTLNERFENLNVIENNFRKNTVSENNFNKFVCHQKRNNIEDPNGFNTRNDLRQLLLSKKNANLIIANDSTVTSNLSGDTRDVHGRSDNNPFIKIHHEDSKKPFLPQTSNERNLLDLTRLKNIAKKCEEDNSWYIVADANVFLNHHKFLNLLVHSDPDCRLIMLQEVLSSLQQTSKCNNKSKRKLAQGSMNFISNIITSGSLILCKGVKLANDTAKAVLDCCLKLIEDNYHNIILLCNDINVKKHKDASTIPIFSVNELKLYLNSNNIGKTGMLMNWNNNELEQDEAGIFFLKELSNKAVDSMLNDNYNTNIDVSTVSSTGVQTNYLTSQKNTAVDAEIQTDLTSEILTQIFTSEHVQKILSNNFEKCSQREVNRERSFIGKPSTLKINSSISDNNKTSGDKECTEKKNYRWRLKRRRSPIGQNKPVKLLKYSINLLENQSNNKTYNNSDDQIIKETSISEVVTDVPRSIDSGGNSRENLSKKFAISLHNKDTNESKNVMFEVTSKEMADNLKTCCDKWISRFIKIMQNVLSLVLQNDSFSCLDSFSSPWSLFELIQFIKIRFCNYSDTFDAAYKLAETLQKMNAGKGENNVNVDPKQYMEMYSYGVYLVDSLQATNSNSEDIQTAAEALAKLLDDIQNPCQVTIHNELIIDPTNETLVNIDNIMDREPEKNPYTSNQKQSGPLSSHNTQWERNFISHNNTAKITGERIIRNSGDQISLSTLRLYQDEGRESDTATNIPTLRPQTPTSEPMSTETESEEISELMSKNKQISVSTKPNETKFIRNFTKCNDFEAKIKGNEIFRTNDEMDCIYSDHDYSGTDSSSEFLCEDYLDSEKNDTNNYNKLSNTINDKNSGFKNVTRFFLQEIRGTLFFVYCFCTEYKNSCYTNDVENNRGTILRAREIHVNLSNLCTHLNSIFRRDEKTLAKNIATKLKCDKDFEGLTFNDIDLKEYRLIISKCLDQAILLRKSIEAILCAHTGVDA